MRITYIMGPGVLQIPQDITKFPNSPLITSHTVYSRVKQGLCDSGEHNTLTQIPLFCFTNETQR